MAGKKITALEIAKKYHLTSQKELRDYIDRQMEAGTLRPIKAHGLDGKTPPVYKDYYLQEAAVDYTSAFEEIKTVLAPEIHIDYYMKHPEVYLKERREVLQLSEYLTYQKEHLQVPVSVNERSFAIWGREKFLKSKAASLLSHSGITKEQLNVYETFEPLVYFSVSKQVPQTVIFVENLDTFYSMRSVLLMKKCTIFGTDVGSLIYGGGNGIVKAMAGRSICAEPYLFQAGNCLLYFGDLDYSGINIYLSLLDSVAADGNIKIEPFVEAYSVMVEKAINGMGIQGLPDTKEGQMVSGIREKLMERKEDFLDYFPESILGTIIQILEAGKYIPQEIVNCFDF